LDAADSRAGSGLRPARRLIALSRHSNDGQSFRTKKNRFLFFFGKKAGDIVGNTLFF